MNISKPVCLVILDGWGESKNTVGNAIANAKLPTIEYLNKYYPKVLLQASGLAVGLPWGTAGNSEVGHQTLGTGQIIYQNLPLIDKAIDDGSFLQNPVLLETIEWTKKNNSSLHLLGLLSDGSVHSHINHLLSLLELAKSQNIDKVFMHLITDGRDSPPKSAKKYLEIVLAEIKTMQLGQIATIIGRYYAMDRNENWDRTEKAFLAFTQGIGILTNNPLSALENQYQQKITDEYLEPIIISDQQNQPLGLIKENDAVICFNFRQDRSRQITKAFVLPDFDKFQKALRPKNLKFTCFTEYEKNLPADIAFPKQEISSCLGKILSDAQKKQLRIAETEKYAHITYFFNNGAENPLPEEDRILIPSKNAKSYDQIPQMSANEITEKLIEAIAEKNYDFILINYANPDMIGHTGNFKAGIKAIETVDTCLKKIIQTILKKSGCLIITADHGNVEEMINLKTYEKDTKHSTNPVPCWFVAENNKQERLFSEQNSVEVSGMLIDIAPTILEILNFPKPAEMIGKSLLGALT